LKISVFGLGYVGTVSLACLAREGHQLIGIDIDPTKRGLIAQGKSPIIEEGLPELIAQVTAQGRVSVTHDLQKAVLCSDLSMICVATPSAPNGSQDQNGLIMLTRQLGAALAGKPGYHLLVYRSTVTPGTLTNVLLPILKAESGRQPGIDFDICFQPEFTREGNSIRDFQSPPFTIVGTDSPRVEQMLRSIFGHLPCEFHVTSIATAEMIKYSCNNFHALKITFANEMGRLCEAFGCDPFEVMSLMSRDTHLNISPAYLRPGFAFGGSCLPKDLRATLHMAKSRDVELPLMASLMQSNHVHVQRAIEKTLAFGKRKVGMIGLSFKSGTDDLRESPLVTLAEYLIGKGMELSIYDPEVHLATLIGSNRKYLEQTIPHIGALLATDCAEVVHSVDLIIIGIHNDAIMNCLCANVRPDQILLDLVDLPGRAKLSCEYHGLCWTRGDSAKVRDSNQQLQALPEPQRQISRGALRRNSAGPAL
jgi:GDP-mannose 6-dehydrogenase